MGDVSARQSFEWLVKSLALRLRGMTRTAPTSAAGSPNSAVWQPR